MTVALWVTDYTCNGNESTCLHATIGSSLAVQYYSYNAHLRRSPDHLDLTFT
jgi:hypothetical protein